MSHPLRTFDCGGVECTLAGCSAVCTKLTGYPTKHAWVDGGKDFCRLFLTNQYALPRAREPSIISPGQCSLGVRPTVVRPV
jgi:hypothetical protein